MDETFVRWLMADEYGLEDDSPDVPGWFAEAACAGRDDVSWFPAKGHPGNDAVRVCQDECPVRQQCLDHALEHDERFGVWGGRTAGQRAELARQVA